MQKKVIAITDITSFGLSEFEQKRFFNRLESELVNINQYTGTNRSEVDKILEEQKFQNSGCTEEFVKTQKLMLIK